MQTMRILTLAPGQALRIGELVVLQLVRGPDRHGIVRLGFTAPRAIPIHRLEVQEVIDAARAKEARHA